MKKWLQAYGYESICCGIGSSLVKWAPMDCYVCFNQEGRQMKAERREKRKKNRKYPIHGKGFGTMVANAQKRRESNERGRKK